MAVHGTGDNARVCTGLSSFPPSRPAWGSPARAGSLDVQVLLLDVSVPHLRGRRPSYVQTRGPLELLEASSRAPGTSRSAGTMLAASCRDGKPRTARAECKTIHNVAWRFGIVWLDKSTGYSVSNFGFSVAVFPDAYIYRPCRCVACGQRRYDDVNLIDLLSVCKMAIWVVYRLLFPHG